MRSDECPTCEGSGEIADHGCGYCMGTGREPWPEHAHLTSVSDQSQAIGQFLDWMNEQGVCLCFYDGMRATAEPRWLPDLRSIEQLLAEFFGINLQELGREKTRMIDVLHEIQLREAKARPPSEVVKPPERPTPPSEVVKPPEKPRPLGWVK